MSAAASVVEYAMQIARAGVAATLAVSLGTSPTAANRVGYYADLTGAAERLSVVVGAIDGAQFRRSGSDVLIVAQAGTRDGIALAPRGGGTTSYLATITSAVLTGSHTYTLSDYDQVLAGSVSALTSGRVPFVTTGGLLTDSAGLAFNGTTALTIGDGTATASCVLNGAAGSVRGLVWQTNGSLRWRERANSVAEGGANAGSNWELIAYDDSAAVIDTPIAITRAAGGSITLVRPLTTSGNFTQTGAGTLSTGTGAVSLNGATTIASGKNLLLSSASIQFGADQDNIRWNAGNVATQGDIDFTGVTSNTATLRIFRGTNTSATRALVIYSGDGTATTMATFSSAATYRLAVNGGISMVDMLSTGNFTQTGATTLSTGTGAVSLNGDTTLAAAKRFGISSLNNGVAINVGSGASGLTGVSQYGFLTSHASASDATTSTIGYVSNPTTSANAYTTTILAGYSAFRGGITLGATSAATRTAAFMARTITVGGTGNGIFVINTADTLTMSGNWGAYYDCALNNYLGTGATLINTTTDDGVSKLQVTGSIKATTNGTAAAPSFNLGATEVHGFYRISATAIGLSIAGAAAIQLGSSAILAQIASAGSYAYGTSVTDGAGIFMSGSSTAAGGQLRTYGSTHATKADYRELSRGSTVDVTIDGTGIVTFANTTVAGIVASGGMTLAKQLRFAQIAGTTVDGDNWYDSTRKTRSAYMQSIQQNITTCVFTSTADAAVTNTTTETTILGTGVGTKTLPANFEVVGKAIRLRVSGKLSNLAAATLQIRVKRGSTVLLDTGVVAIVGTITNGQFNADVMLTCRATGASGSIQGNIAFEYSNGTTRQVDGAETLTTVDTTASGALDVMATWGAASASNTITGSQCSIEVIN